MKIHVFKGQDETDGPHKLIDFSLALFIVSLNIQPNLKILHWYNDGFSM